MKIDQEAKIPAETLKGLKELGLFGIMIPEENGEIKGFCLIMDCLGITASVSLCFNSRRSWTVPHHVRTPE